MRGAGGERSALTSIHFLLVAGECSRWHRVLGADEVWQLSEGGPLELFDAPPSLETVRRRVLAVPGVGEPLLVVPAGHWQAARPLGLYSLAGCSVGPGFEFADFSLLSGRPEAAEFIRRHPQLAPLV